MSVVWIHGASQRNSANGCEILHDSQNTKNFHLVRTLIRIDLNLQSELFLSNMFFPRDTPYFHVFSLSHTRHLIGINSIQIY